MIRGWIIQHLKTFGEWGHIGDEEEPVIKSERMTPEELGLAEIHIESFAFRSPVIFLSLFVRGKEKTE